MLRALSRSICPSDRTRPETDTACWPCCEARGSNGGGLGRPLERKEEEGEEGSTAGAKGRTPRLQAAVPEAEGPQRERAVRLLLRERLRENQD